MSYGAFGYASGAQILVASGAVPPSGTGRMSVTSNRHKVSYENNSVYHGFSRVSADGCAFVDGRLIYTDGTFFMFDHVIIYLFINLLSMAILAFNATENGMRTRWHPHFRHISCFMDTFS